MKPYQTTFLDLALQAEVLKFGEFTLKSGRVSPYFFNLGRISSGAALRALGRAYAEALIAHGVEFDLLFGPAYKGIPLVASTAIALAVQQGRNVPWAFNRKEAKDHGEGGQIVGTPLSGKVVIVDDVITAGTAIRESVELIRRAGAEPVGVLLAVDRQERGQGERSAVQEVEAEFGLRCVSLLTLTDLIDILADPNASRPALPAEQLAALREYRARYGIHAASPQ